jgi:hypothetical protein
MATFVLAYILSLAFHTFFILNTSNKKYVHKNSSIYLFHKFNFRFQIDGEGNPNTPFLKWLLQYEIF